jgi:lysophospholipase L1-like esterase
VDDLRVIFVGDSFVAGVGDPTGQGWVGRLVAGAFAAGIPLTPYNLGVRGDTSTDVLQRWQAEARARIAPEADCRVVFSFGANDTTVENGTQRVPLTDSVANLSRAITGAAALALRVLIVGPPPANDREQRDRISALSASFATVASDHAVPYVDVVGSLRDSSAWTAEAQADDGAHPASGGYALLAELVLEPWLNWLRHDAAGGGG